MARDCEIVMTKKLAIRSSGTAAKANPYRFSTKYQDDESDLLSYVARCCTAKTW